MADLSPLSVNSKASAVHQEAAAKKNDGLESSNEVGIVENGEELKEDEEVFSDAPEAPIDDQNGVLGDKDVAFVGGGEMVSSVKTVDGEFGPAELREEIGEEPEVENGEKDGILGGVEGGAIANSSVVQDSEEKAVVVEDSEKDENFGEINDSSLNAQSSEKDEVGAVEKDEILDVEIGGATSSVIGENKVEKFEKVNYEGSNEVESEGTVDVKKVRHETVTGEMKEAVTYDSSPDEDAVVYAAKGADDDERSSELNKDVPSDDASKEEILVLENASSNSFEKTGAEAGESADNDEKGGEEMKQTSSDGVPEDIEQDNSVVGIEQVKADAGSLAKDVDGIASPYELTSVDNVSVGTDQAVVESEANKGVGVPELAADGVNEVSVKDSELAPAVADHSESSEALVTETAPKEVNGVSNNVEEDHNIQDSEEEALDALEAAEELEDDYTNSHYSQLERLIDVDGQIASDSDEEAETDEENSDKEMIDAEALAALLKAASSSAHEGSLSVSSQDGNRIFMVDRPAGLGSSIPSLRPGPPRSARSVLSSSEMAMTAVPDNDMTEEEKVLHDKVELIKVKFLRLVQRLGHSPEETVVAQVLYRLSLAEGIRHGWQNNRAFSLEKAKKKAQQLEAEGKEALDFSCNILVVGKSGVGKSATINSIFGGEKSHTDAFEPATDAIKEITGSIDGVNVRIIDTPGLRVSTMDQASNRKILLAIKKYTKNCQPDIVLYVDRMDTQTRDLNDLPLLKSITNILGPSIWFNAIVALTHAASAPPDGPSGAPLSYEVYLAQRSHVIQQSIRLAAGDMRLMSPVSLVENHQSCRKNREGQKVLPNGLAWRPQMLLLCYSSKILSEANSLLKLQDAPPKKLFGLRFRSPPLPFLLSSLLQSKPHPKLTPEQGGDAVDSDIELDDFPDSDQDDEEDEYDQLPPFKPLSKGQIAKLTKEQRKAYFDEFDYRVKLLQKKQWKDELKRMKEMKKGGKRSRDDFGYGDMAEDFEQDSAPATVPVPLPDMILPPSFDCEAPTYRYRFLEPTSHLLARPVLDTHGWDHDCGYDGISLEESLAIASRFPAVITAQVTKDKKEFSIHLESSVSAKHGENGSSLAGFNIQAVGKQLAYTFLGETKFKNLKKNKTAGGISVTFLGETVATGLKFEDQLSIGKRVNLVSSVGAVRSQSDTAYGANLEARLQDKEYPIGQTLTTLGLSIMRWHSDLALGANLQSQFAVSRNSKMAVRVGLNNKLTGQISVKTSSSEHQLALVGIIPVAISIYRTLMGGME